MLDSRQLIQATEELTIKRCARLVAGIGLCGQFDHRSKRMVCFKTAIYAHQPKETRCQQAGHQHQGHADGDFHCDQQPAKSLAVARFARKSRFAVQHFVRLGGGTDPRWNCSSEESG